MGTFEEHKQQLIVRQSQMERAIQYCTLIGIKPNPTDVILMADVFTEFVFNGRTKDVLNRSKLMNTYIKENYLANEQKEN
jgi:hypothetical protein